MSLFSFFLYFFLFLGTSRRPLPFYRFRTNDVLLWHFLGAGVHICECLIPR